MNNDARRDLVVIGAGAGGLVVASVAAQLGLDVVLIEKQAQMGGDCLHYGCVPSKALLKSAHIAHYLRDAERFGFQAVEPNTDMSAVNAFVKRAIDTIQPHDSHERFQSLGCEVLTGEAKFIDANTVEISGRKIRAKRFVIATGSAPWAPPIEGMADVDTLSNEDMYSLEQLPQHSTLR